MDISQLAKELKRQVSGTVSFATGDRALYAMDGSNYRQVPIGVVIPRTIEDVVATMSVCRSFGAPIFSRGGGTSLSGQCCNAAIVMDWSRHLNKILEINGEERFARVQPVARCCGPAWFDVGTGSGDTHTLHLWRNDREQFVRRALANGGKDC